MDAALHAFFEAQRIKTTNLNTNVELSTGSKAYINKYGIAKEYGTTADYTLTAGLNSCGSSVPTPLDRTWATLMHPRGTAMAPGAPCGFENSYITSSFPSSVTEGDSISAGMTQMGKVGYIDIDNIYHPVTTTYSSTYKPPHTSYVSGTTMTSCLGGKVHYGDAIYIKYGTSYAYTSSDVVKVSSTETASIYYLQPLTGTSKAEINYGDACLLTTTNVSSSSTCGLWGCKVGSVSSIQQLELTSSRNGIPFRFLPALRSNTNQPIKIGDSLSIVAKASSNTLINGTVMTNRTAPYLTSKNGTYTLKFVDSTLAIYNSSNSIKTTIYTITSPSTTSKVLFDEGKFIFYDTSGTGATPQKIIPTSLSGNTSPYKAILCDSDGELVIIDGTDTVVWPSTKTDFDTPDSSYASVASSVITFTTEPTYEFSITSPYYGDGTQCNVDALKQFCAESSKCVGFIHSGTNHNWQFINTDDTADKYQMSTTYTDTYLRNLSIGVSGTNCPSTSTITSVPWNHMLLFPKGSALPVTGAVCPSIPPVIVPEYDKYMNDLTAKFNSLDGKGLTATNITSLTAKTSSLASSSQNYTTAYERILDQFNSTNPTNKTIQQRITDSSVLDEHHKSLAILWGIISISVISIILFRPSN
jgi:hypothetical protein